MHKHLTLYGLSVPALVLAFATIHLNQKAEAEPVAASAGHEIWFTDGTNDHFIGYGDQVEFTNARATSTDVDLHAWPSLVYLRTETVQANDTEIWSISGEVVVSDPGSQPDDVKGLCGRNCFPADTTVRLDGSETSFDALQTGALLSTGAEIQELVESQSLTLVKLSVGDDQVRTTQSHRFLTPQRGWVAASELVAGDALVVQGDRADRPTVTLTEVEILKLTEPVKVYDLRLEHDGEMCVGQLGLIAEAKGRK